MTLDIRQTEDIDACLAVRRAVFIVEQGVEEGLDLDGLEDQAVHILARLEGRAVGTARLMVLDGGIGKVGRVAVLSDCRGTGIGAKIMLEAVAIFRARGDIAKVKLSSQAHAIGFYEKLGFTVVGEPYEDAGIPHLDMVLPI